MSAATRGKKRFGWALAELDLSCFVSLPQVDGDMVGPRRKNQ
jgi:hypothetical protein